MPNRVFLHPKGYIEQVFDGPQTRETMRQNEHDSVDLIAQLRKEGKFANVLANGVGVTDQDSGARKAGVELLRNLDFTKFAAVLETNAFIKHIANFVIVASGKRNARVLDTREEAESWFSEENGKYE